MFLLTRWGQSLDLILYDARPLIEVMQKRINSHAAVKVVISLCWATILLFFIALRQGQGMEMVFLSWPGLSRDELANSVEIDRGCEA